MPSATSVPMYWEQSSTVFIAHVIYRLKQITGNVPNDVLLSLIVTELHFLTVAPTALPANIVV